MATSWPLVPAPTPVANTPPSFTVNNDKAFLGSGLLRPFRRDKKNDFANATGATLVASAVGQVLGTRASSDNRVGELPWRTDFGSLIYLMRFRNNDGVFKELARTYVQDALQRWEPRARVQSVSVFDQDDGQGGTVPVVFTRFDIIDENVPGNNVIVAGAEVAIPLL